MITLTREEAQQVLEAFEGVFEGDDKGAEFWTVYGGTFEAVYCMNAMRLLRAKLAAWTPDDTAHRPGGLPQPERQWQGLTEQEHANIAVEAGCASADWVFYGAAVERALKEKNK
jgi:hypothetical protein